MATVLFKRGSSADMADTPVQDGLLFYNTENHKIYMDNGTERLQYGGDTELITDPASASSTNAFNSTGSLNLFLQKTTVVDSKSNALAVTSDYVPLGCKAFKEMLGLGDYASIGDGTVSGGLISLRGETISDTLIPSANSIQFTSSILTSDSYVDIYTDDWTIAPETVTTNISDPNNKTITLSDFPDRDNSVRIRVLVRNM